MTMRVQPTTSGDDIAQFLRDRQIDYDVVSVPISDIDIEKSKRNQARFLPIHDDTVLTYGAAMEQGDSFPPVILSGQKSGKYLVLDGNHRIAAAGLAGYSMTTAFVTKNISQAQAELVTFEANARHGLPTTVEERIQQALYLVNIGNRAKSVAKALAVPEQRLYKAVTISRGAERLSKLGEDPKKFSQAMLSRLSSIPSNTVLAPVAEIVRKSFLNSDEVSEMVTAVNAEQGGEAAQMRVVEQYRERYKSRMRSTAGGKLEIPENISRVRQMSRLVRNIDGSLLVTQLSKMDDDAAESVRREIYESIATLVSITGSFKNASA